MYHALTVAKYVIDYTNRNGKSISNLKLQKVLYFLQAEFLVSTGNVCFMDRIEAWDFGPVVPAVYHQFSIFGAASIPKIRNDTTYFIFYDKDILSEHRIIINRMVDALSDYSAADMVRITQNQAPWKNAYRSRHITNEITRESLKAYFSEGKQEGRV